MLDNEANIKLLEEKKIKIHAEVKVQQNEQEKK